MPTFGQLKGILLDIEGTTSSISFVHDRMFPFVLQHLDDFLGNHWDDREVQEVCRLIAIDRGSDSLASWHATASSPDCSPQELVASEVRQLMGRDVKATGLKALQGLIWRSGFESGELVSHTFDDVIPAIRRWRSEGLDIRIYSSGSIAAQKLFFAHVAKYGNCLELFTGHYDTTSGGKKEPASYLAVATDWGLQPSDILFVSDLEAELIAAREAGLQVCASVRPGNAPLSSSHSFATVESFAEIDTDSSRAEHSTAVPS